MSEKAIIFDIQKFSVHDGPGIRTVIFFKGCSLDCEWCANPESKNAHPELMYYPAKCIGCKKCIDACKNNAIFMEDGKIIFDRRLCRNCGMCTEVCYANARKMTGKEYDIESVKREIDKDLVFFKNSGGGVTFSGGEPLLWPDFIKKLAKYYKEKGISLAIETCGNVPWKNFEKILDYIDLIMFDLKFMHPEKHSKNLGCSNELILENLLKSSKYIETIVRIPIIPGINNTEKDIVGFGEFLSSISERVKRVEILPYHNLAMNKYKGLGKKYKLESLKTPNDSLMENIKKRLEKYGLNVKIGG